MNRTRTGTIPGRQCPTCGGDLLVIDKPQTNITHGRNPQFVGCSNYFLTGCNYRTTVTADVYAIMEQVQQEADLQPAEF